MAEKKNQHYVPKFYLRNFSKTGKSINVYNISNQRIICGDSIKNQCSSDYFYGKNGLLENTFQEIETQAGSILKNISDKQIIPKLKTKEHSVLQIFLATLKSRTKFKFGESNETIDRIAKSTSELHPYVSQDMLNKVSIKYDNPLQQPLKIAFSNYHLLQDLNIHILYNNTLTDFVTSDNPVIYFNKWTQHIKECGSIGLASKGLLIILPINPTILLVLYDSSIYKLGTKKQTKTEINAVEEIEEFDRLQWLNAEDNIYFFDSDSSSYIENIAEQIIDKRDPEKVKLHELNLGKEGKIIGFQPRELNSKLSGNSIKVLRKAKQIPILKGKPKIRKPKLLKLVEEFQNNIDEGKFNVLEWNEFIESKANQLFRLKSTKS